jgi:colicin import membrane protein
MTRLQKKCFIGSAGFHGLLLMIFIFGSAFLNSPKKQVNLAVVTVYAMPTDRKISTGGSPNGTPTPPAPKAEPPKQAPAPEPPKPVPPKVEPPKPQVVHKAEPVVPKPEVVKATPKPVKLPDKVLPKEHGDFAVKPPKKTKEKPLEKEKESESKPTPHISTRVVKRTNDLARIERERQEKAVREAREKAQREWQEQITAFNRAQAVINSQVAGLVSGVGKDLGKTTVVTPLGDGGVAFVQYGPLIRELYDRAWVEPPSLTDEDGTVNVKITIARNGKVLGASIEGKSGIPALDKSVRRALDSVRVVPPFPPESTDTERTFKINFNLKAKRMST